MADVDIDFAALEAEIDDVLAKEGTGAAGFGNNEEVDEISNEEAKEEVEEGFNNINNIIYERLNLNRACLMILLVLIIILVYKEEIMKSATDEYTSEYDSEVSTSEGEARELARKKWDLSRTPSPAKDKVCL